MGVRAFHDWAKMVPHLLMFFSQTSTRRAYKKTAGHNHRYTKTYMFVTIVIHLCEIVCVCICTPMLQIQSLPFHINIISTIFLLRDTEMTCGNSRGASLIGGTDLAIFSTSLLDNVNSRHSKPRVICGS